MTIIYSNWKDEDCLYLQRVWAGISYVNIIEITSDCLYVRRVMAGISGVDIFKGASYDDIIDDAINNEDDTLIFIGHGTDHGLLAPDLSYILHENNFHLIRAVNVIFCWCYASTFAQDHGFRNTFATSMFISNVEEAYDNAITNYTQSEINEVNIRIYDEMNEMLRTNVPLSCWQMMLRDHIDINNSVDTFNRGGLFYSPMIY